MVTLETIGNDLISRLKKEFPFFQNGYLAQYFTKSDGKTYIVTFELLGQDRKMIEMLHPDTRGNYFYLYFGDDNIVFEDSEPFTACQDAYQMSIPAKLVFWAMKANVYNLFYLVNRFLIANAHKLDSLVALKIDNANMNPRKIIFDELGTDQRKLPEDLTLLSYDLTFIIKTEYLSYRYIHF